MIKITPPIRPIDVESLEDFSRYYRYSYVGWYGHPNGPSPVSVQVAGADIVALADLEGAAFTLNWEAVRKDISFGVPDLGMVNSDHTIIYLHQTAPRQAHKGYRPNGVIQTLFNGWDLRKVQPQASADNKEVIKNLFFPTYYEPAAALSTLRKGKRAGCALSRHLGLYTTSSEKHPSIAYRRRTVGYIDDDTNRAMIIRSSLDAFNVIRKTMPGTEVILL